MLQGKDAQSMTQFEMTHRRRLERLLTNAMHSPQAIPVPPVPTVQVAPLH